MRFLKTLALLALLLPAAPARAAEGMMLVRDEEIEQTLKAFARPVFEQAGVSAGTVRFILVQDDALNAFVAGGQNIFIHTGLLLKAENAGEVAGVIAHETGHIALGHLFRARASYENMQWQAMLATVAGAALGAATGSGGAGMAVAQAGRDMAFGAAMGHSREQESAADEAGVRFLKGARLPLAGFLSFMEKLGDQELLPASQQVLYARTHPLTRDRTDFLRHAAQQARPGEQPPAWEGLHARMQAKLLGFVFPDRALADRGPGIPARYGRAIAEYRQGRTDKAIALVDGLLKEEPENPWFHELKGQVLFEAGRVEASVAPYARASALFPRSGLLRAAYGHALLETGTAENRAAAIRQLLSALTVEPRGASTHHLLAIAYGKSGQEGLSRLHLAERYALEGKPVLARKEARFAFEALRPGTPARLRAQDLLDQLDENAETEKKR